MHENIPCDMPDKHLEALNYKLLNNVLCIKAFWGTWNQDTHSQCNTCHINESSKHLIFECEMLLKSGMY